MPTPPRATPAGSSHIAPRRSDHIPKSGWINDEDACEASTTAPTAVYESEKRSLRNGNNAGRAPFAKSVAKWPLERSAIARRSISARTLAGYRASSELKLGGVRVLGREEALDQRVRELPLRAGELDPVALEPQGVGTQVAQPLAFGREPGDLVEQHLDGGAIVPTPEARRNSWPQNRAHGRGHHRHATRKVEPRLGRIRKETVKPSFARSDGVLNRRMREQSPRILYAAAQALPWLEPVAGAARIASRPDGRGRDRGLRARRDRARRAGTPAHRGRLDAPLERRPARRQA